MEDNIKVNTIIEDFQKRIEKLQDKNKTIESKILKCKNMITELENLLK